MISLPQALLLAKTSHHNPQSLGEREQNWGEDTPKRFQLLLSVSRFGVLVFSIGLAAVCFDGKSCFITGF